MKQNSMDGSTIVDNFKESRGKISMSTANKIKVGTMKLQQKLRQREVQ